MFILSEVDKEYVSVPEAARRLGVTPAYLYKLINDGKIKPYRREINNRIVVLWDDLAAKFQPKPADEQTESE